MEQRKPPADDRPLFGGHHGHVDLLLSYAASGQWPAALAARELRDLARQAFQLGLRAAREARKLDNSSPT